ncbi:hypothetical protein FKM82_026510, partial [Ascaphus truei]
AGALTCYNCKSYSAEKCQSNTECTVEEDACLQLFRTDGATWYQCYPYSKCNRDRINTDFGINNFSYKCCQSNLCNGSVRAGLANAALLLSLTAALILHFSR